MLVAQIIPLIKPKSQFRRELFKGMYKSDIMNL